MMKRRGRLTFAAIALVTCGQWQPIHSKAEEIWVKCKFNAAYEDCSIAGGSSSFTLTFRSDQKRITVEKVGTPHECGDGSSDICGKALITEVKERRSTWASYRQTRNEFLMTSSRGNRYRIPM
jgi:hypothetical protein